MATIYKPYTPTHLSTLNMKKNRILDTCLKLTRLAFHYALEKMKRHER